MLGGGDTRDTGEGCMLTCIYSRLHPVREHVPHDVVVDADERLHDGIGRRRVAALREREQVEQFLQRQTIRVVKPFSSRSREPQITRNSAGYIGNDALRLIDLPLLAFSVYFGLRGMSNADSRASVVAH